MASEHHTGRSSGLAPGTRVAGRFEVERELGTGGMADVYQVRDLAGSRRLALKILRAEVARDREAVGRLRREGQVLEQLEHPVIVALETFGELEQGGLFIAMELLEGETLGARMRRGPMEAGELSPILREATAGLQAAHDHGIVHRDLKPDNLFLCSSGEAPVRILDFGISKVLGADRLTQTGQILGTPRYMAPEQLSAEPDLDGRVDVYALGVILYEALCGQSPFASASPSDLIVAVLRGQVVPLRSVAPEVSPELEAVVMRAMAPDKETRYHRVEDLWAAWEEVAPAGSDRVSLAPGSKTEMLGRMDVPKVGAAPRGELDPGTLGSRARTSPRRDATPSGCIASDVRGKTRMGPSSEMQSNARSPGEGVVPPGQGEPEAGPSPRPRSGARQDEPMVLPVRAPRLRLVLGGIAAAALSAAAVVFILSSMDRSAGRAGRSGDPERSTGQPKARNTLAAADGAAPGEGRESGLPSGDSAGAADGPMPATTHAASTDPQGTQSPSSASEDSPSSGTAEPDGPQVDVRRQRARRARARARARRRRLARRRAASKSTSAMAENENGSSASGASSKAKRAEPSSAAGWMRRARAAHRTGEFDRCEELVRKALDAGAPASVLRLRADCLLLADHRDEARRVYERFCRLVPDHPAIGEVRSIVASLGGTCP